MTYFTHVLQKTSRAVFAFLRFIFFMIDCAFFLDVLFRGDKVFDPDTMTMMMMVRRRFTRYL